MYKVKNLRSSEQISLAKSIDSQDTQGKQLSEAIALGSYEPKSNDTEHLTKIVHLQMRDKLSHPTMFSICAILYTFFCCFGTHQ